MNKHPEYNFSKEIQDKLKKFKTHLKRLKYKENTARQKTNYTGYFLKWIENENLQIQETRYNDLLNFIDYCKLEGNSNKHINNKLLSIRNYYDYLKNKNPSLTNPARNLYLRGVRQKLPANIIEFTKLEKLYTSHKPQTLRDKRNKIILSLLIYQGITTEELHQLQPEHLKLTEGKIYVPGNSRRNSRKLELKPFQILELHEYLLKVRPKILDAIINITPTFRAGRKPERINKARLETKLFVSINGSESLKNSLYHMFRAIQKINPDIRQAKQIRSSVITYWLKKYNLRQVQYMAGHKYVSSTERYQLNHLHSLQQQIETLHPLNTPHPMPPLL
ncbi:MAG: site-specific integrase [Bacteroidales bacterium]|nr:site-specific integrase [Bacteroidales bacterium]